MGSSFSIIPKGRFMQVICRDPETRTVSGGVDSNALIWRDENMFRVLSLILAGMMIAGCAAAGRTGSVPRDTAPKSVLNKTWQWEATITPVEKITVPNPERYTILLGEDGKVQARFDCNRGGGEYKISAGNLSFGPLLSTRMAFPPDSRDGPFMRDLTQVVSFFMEDGHLYLELPFDSGTMKFRPTP